MYRVWCRDKHEWEADEIAMRYNGTLMHSQRTGASILSSELKPENHVLQLCTGLTDINNNSVYEGDIVDQGDNYQSIVRFDINEENGFAGFYLEEMDARVPEDKRPTHELFSYTTIPNEWKIVGNIFDKEFKPTKKEQPERPNISRYERLEME